MDGITIVLHPVNIYFQKKKWLRDAVGDGGGVAGWMKPGDWGFKGAWGKRSGEHPAFDNEKSEENRNRLGAVVTTMSQRFFVVV